MDYLQVNELDRAIKNFTLEQMEAAQKLAEYLDEHWSRNDFINGLERIHNDVSREALELAFDDCSSGPRETSDALQLVMENILFKAACYKVALDQRDFGSETDDDVEELPFGSYGAFPITQKDSIAAPQPAVGLITPAA